MEGRLSLFITDDNYKEIFWLLAKKELINVRLVSKKFYELSQNIFWHKCIETDFYIKCPLSPTVEKKTFADHRDKLNEEKKKLTSKFFIRFINDNVDRIMQDESSPQLTKDEQIFIANARDFFISPTETKLDVVLSYLKINEEEKLLHLKNYLFAVNHVLALPVNKLNQESICCITMVATKDILSPTLKIKFDKIFGEGVCDKDADYKMFAENVIQTIINSCLFNCEIMFNILINKQPQLANIFFAKKHGVSLLHAALKNFNLRLMETLLMKGNLVKLDKAYLFSSNNSVNR